MKSKQGSARMTRENKLALVIGFGLLLLAGILVSDHLSSGQRSSEEPLLASGEKVVPPSTLLTSRPEASKLNTTQEGNSAKQRDVRARGTAAEPEPLRQITIGGTSAKVATRPDTTRSSSAVAKQPTVHFVRSGETLSAISKKYYGTPDHAAQIARNNNISNPQHLGVGTRLVLADDPRGSIRANQAAAPIRQAQTTAPRKRMVTVKEGETLSEIAKRELGSEGKWHELWEMNKKAVPNPNRLRPGTTLNLPAT